MAASGGGDGMADFGFAQEKSRPGRLWLLGFGGAVMLFSAIVLDTHYRPMGDAAETDVFSPERFGQTTFPRIRDFVEKKAVDAQTLSLALSKDKAEAIKSYGVENSLGPVFPVSFSGTFGERKGNMNRVSVQGLPDDVTVYVQTGPAVNGTEIRDATGDIHFGAFTNQIAYQNAGSALNNEVKKTVFTGLDPMQLATKPVKGMGVFRLINPKMWIITPVRLEIQ